MSVDGKVCVLSPEAPKVAQFYSVLGLLNLGFSSRKKQGSAGCSTAVAWDCVSSQDRAPASNQLLVPCAVTGIHLCNLQLVLSAEQHEQPLKH